MSDINITIRLASKAAQQGIDAFGTSAGKAGKKVKGFQAIIKNTQGAFNSFIGNLGAVAVTRAIGSIVNGIGNAVNNMKAFETALVGVGKTTGLAGKELEQLGKQIETLSTEIPVSATELLKLGQTAAQLGVTGTNNIIKFTDTMARLAVATDVVGEEGAIAFAKIINITGESVGNIDKLGSSLVALGNTFATTERQIITVANEVAKGGGRFGLTAEQVLGLSTAMSALGTEAQVAGSTIQKVFGDVEKAIGAGPDELQKFSDVLGITNDELTDLFETSPDQFFLQLVEGLGRAEQDGKKLSTSLKELGFEDRRVTKTLGPLINRTDLLTKALNLSSEAYKENIALTEESAAAFDTLDSDLTILDNNWKKFTNSILNQVLPAMKFVIQTLSDFIKFVRESTIAQGILIAIAGGFALLAIKATIAAAAALAAWAAITLPVVAVVAGIGLVIAGILKLIKHWDEIKLGILAAQRSAQAFFGRNTEALDKEIELLRQKIDLQNKTTEGVKAETEAQKAKKSVLDSIVGGAVGDPEAEAKKVEQAEIKKNRKVKEGQEERLRILEEYGDLELALLQAKGQQAALIDGEIDKQEEIQIQKNINRLSNRQAAERAFLQRKLGNVKEAIAIERQLEVDKLNQSNSIREMELEAQRQQQQKQLELAQEFYAIQDELTLARAEEEALADGEIDAQEEIRLQKKADDFANLVSQKEIDRQRDLGNLAKAYNLELKLEADRVKQSNNIKKKEAATQKAIEKQKVADRAASLNTIATLQSSNNKTLATIGKAAALTQIAISGPVAVAKAFEAFPPPFSFVAAAAVAAAVAAQAAKVVGVSFEDGGIVPGNSFSGDNVQANVNSGEMILNRQQQAQLFQQANGQTTGGSGAQGDIVVQIDGTEVFRAVSRQVADGGVLGEGGV